ncbi:hypothetical protein [Desulfobacca acetoxidans]
MMNEQPTNCRKIAYRRNRLLTSMLAVLIGAAISGCAQDSALRDDYGNSWAYNQAVQIVNPQAALTESPATGMSPKAAITNMEGFNKSFERQQPEKAAASFIQLGTGGK